MLKTIARAFRRPCFVAGAVACCLAGPWQPPAHAGAHAESEADEAEVAELTAEQAAMAVRMDEFIAATEQSFFAKIETLNGSLDLEAREFSYEEATHDVKVSRGPVAEKAGWYVNIQKKGKPPYVPDALYSRYMEANVHAANPHVGMLHATVYFTVLKNGRGMLAGYMDYVPAVVHEQDNRQLKQAVEAVFDRHGEDITRFRHELCESKFGAEQHRDKLRAACVGASLYARPMLEANVNNLDLVTETFTAFTDAYFEILDKRKDQAFTDADVTELDAMRKRWFEDQMFADTFAKKVVPYEVWSMANLPPEVRF